MSKLRFFAPYYAALGLPPDADNAAIKAAYRRMAKLYHPDKSGKAATREKFIEVNQAYEMLMKRDELISAALLKHYQNKQGAAPKEGFRRRQDMARRARQRAANHAEMPFAKFEKTRIYRTAAALYSVFDYVMIFTAMVMICAPVLAYFEDMTRLMPRAQEPVFHVAPVFIGLALLYGLWYFKSEK